MAGSTPTARAPRSACPTRLSDRGRRGRIARRLRQRRSGRRRARRARTATPAAGGDRVRGPLGTAVSAVEFRGLRRDVSCHLTVVRLERRRRAGSRRRWGRRIPTPITLRCIGAPTNETAEHGAGPASMSRGCNLDLIPTSTVLNLHLVRPRARHVPPRDVFHALTAPRTGRVRRAERVGRRRVAWRQRLAGQPLSKRAGDPPGQLAVLRADRLHPQPTAASSSGSGGAAGNPLSGSGYHVAAAKRSRRHRPTPPTRNAAR